VVTGTAWQEAAHHQAQTALKAYCQQAPAAAKPCHPGPGLWHNSFPAHEGLPLPTHPTILPTQAGILSLELDLVHNPHTMSEFEAHAKQTLDVTDAHYHFNTESGVKVDAHAFLNGLDNNGFRVEGGCAQHPGNRSAHRSCMAPSVSVMYHIIQQLATLCNAIAVQCAEESLAWR